MAEFLYRHERRLAMRRHEADETAFSHEIVPWIETGAVQEFAAELSPVPPKKVPLRDDDYYLYGWPADGVRERIGMDGCSIGQCLANTSKRPMPHRLPRPTMRAMPLERRQTMQQAIPRQVAIPTASLMKPGFRKSKLRSRKADCSSGRTTGSNVAGTSCG